MSRRAIDLGHKAVRAIGVDIVRYQATTHPLARRMRLLESYDVDLILDVGANDGGYAMELRRLGYRGRIVSFEPLPDASERLRAQAHNDDAWDVRAVAVGRQAGWASINIAGNSASSSLLPMLPKHEDYAPHTGKVGEATVEIQRLDDIADDVIGDARRPLLKMDTQGYEAHILDGALDTLGRFVGVQTELSIPPLYAGAPSYLSLLRRLSESGFDLMGLEPGFSDSRTGRLLQFDAILYRTDVTGGGDA